MWWQEASMRLREPENMRSLWATPETTRAHRAKQALGDQENVVGFR